MPATARYEQSLKINLSDVEMAFLKFLQWRTGETMADHVRRALASYAGRLEDDVVGHFIRAARKSYPDGLRRDPARRADYDAALDAFRLTTVRLADGPIHTRRREIPTSPDRLPDFKPPMDVFDVE